MIHDKFGFWEYASVLSRVVLSPAADLLLQCDRKNRTTAKQPLSILLSQ